MTGYTETILKYVADSSRTGCIEPADGTGECGLSGPDVGARLAVRFTLKVARDRLENVRFQVFGCGFTIAACAAAAELSEGRSLDEIQQVTPVAINRALENGLPEERSYCAELASLALQAAVASARKDSRPVQTDLNADKVTADEHGPRISPSDPLYCSLMNSPERSPASVPADRRMFACLLTVAAREPWPLTQALGLESSAVDAVFATYFPEFTPSRLDDHGSDQPALPPELNPDVLEILLSHAHRDSGGRANPAAEWLAHILAARAAHPGHLWVSMGFFERSELTAAIRRHLPSLAEANNQGMRWKRYLFKQACARNGGIMCKSPNCGVCSDYALCFVEED